MHAAVVEDILRRDGGLWDDRVCRGDVEGRMWGFESDVAAGEIEILY